LKRFVVPVPGGRLDLTGPPLIMGILNVTPDSFSDGGSFRSPLEAAERAFRMAEDGAAIIDVGGESTRPGSEPVTAEEELRRVLPVLRELSGKTKAILSIDTTKAAVAREAVAAGAGIVNDTSALADDPELAAVVRESGCAVILMHRRGVPATMQIRPHYDCLFGEMIRELSARMDFATSAGIDRERILIDPGIGFGKRLEDNLDLHRGLGRLEVLGRPIVFGPSRKGFIGTLRAARPSKGFSARRRPWPWPCERRARLRVHDVKEMREVIQVAAAIGGTGVIDGLLSMRAVDFLDILLVSFIIYWLLLFIRGTRAVQMLFGLLMLMVLYVISKKAGWSRSSGSWETSRNLLVVLV
jgi:dihydropteroate synthase